MVRVYITRIPSDDHLLSATKLGECQYRLWVFLNGICRCCGLREPRLISCSPHSLRMILFFLLVSSFRFYAITTLELLIFLELRRSLLSLQLLDSSIVYLLKLPSKSHHGYLLAPLRLSLSVTTKWTMYFVINTCWLCVRLNRIEVSGYSLCRHWIEIYLMVFYCYYCNNYIFSSKSKKMN